MADEESETLEEDQEDMMEDNEDIRSDMMEDNQDSDGYGSPVPDAKHNTHSFLHKATFESPSTIKTTYLSEGELGRPLFTVRFLLELHDLSIHYLNKDLEELKLKPENYNILEHYFREKVENITGSGMSNKGFAMNLNVTQKRDTVRKKIKEVPRDGQKTKP